jgi:ribosome-associated toxin RatA of RatAB toxin-antitoxin module
MRTHRFSASTVIRAPQERVFDFTQDYGQRLKWDTFLIEARLVEGATSAGKGVKAWCVAHNGMGMETEYVSFRRPKVTGITMTKGPRMFRSFSGSWNFKPMPDGATEVVFTYSFRLRLPHSLAGFWVRRTLLRNVRQRLADLKVCLETG